MVVTVPETVVLAAEVDPEAEVPEMGVVDPVVPVSHLQELSRETLQVM
jgi:hypothetical protein